MAYVNKEKTKQVREDLKKEFPVKDGWKFSVRKEHSSTVIVSILKAPVDFGTTHEQLNHYHLNWYDHSEILKKIVKIANKGNYNNSNPMIDYFDVGFYLHLEVGKWDKPFEYVQK